MNIAIIGSGGDGAGMNQCLYQMVKKLKFKHNVILFYRGYQGLIDNTIANFSFNKLKKERTKGGIIIKSSRSADFMTTKGFNKAIKNLKQNSIDALIIMGGNGSLQGAKKLAQNGVNCIFIPTTIDNDIKQSNYSIGFDTAVENAVDFVNKVDTSMQAFDRICIYEVMGRHCSDIANSVSKKVEAKYCYTSQSSFEDCLKKVKQALKNGILPKIILQENVINSNDLKQYLMQNLKNADVKIAVVGYVQRGGDATKTELVHSTNFANLAAKCISKKHFNKIVCFNNCNNNYEIKNI